MTERVRPSTGLHQAHRVSGFYEEPCRHHPFGEPSIADRIASGVIWTLLGATFMYFGAHLLAAALR